MSNPSTVKVVFCFPHVNNDVKDGRGFASLLVSHLQKSGDIEYAGYLNDDDLYDDLFSRIGSFDIKLYNLPNANEIKFIKKTIVSSINKCYERLPLVIRPVFVFIFPWFPTSEDRKLFAGANAVAPHARTIHIFIDPPALSAMSIKQTVAHEYNHIVFYQEHRTKKYSLIQNIIIEGLAENFRETIFGGKPAPWSMALHRIEARKVLRSLEAFFPSKSSKLYEDVFFGSKKFTRWTGYSVGYWLVKNFINGHGSLSWQEIMQKNPEDFIEQFI